MDAVDFILVTIQLNQVVLVTSFNLQKWKCARVLGIRNGPCATGLFALSTTLPFIIDWMDPFNSAGHGPDWASFL